METGGARLLVAPLDSVALLSVDSVALPFETARWTAKASPHSAMHGHAKKCGQYIKN
jgi:hypothetical protein